MNYHKLDWLFSEKDLIISLPILLTLVFFKHSIGLFQNLIKLKTYFTKSMILIEPQLIIFFLLNILVFFQWE